MKKLWAVTAREYMERVRTRWFVISTVFGPLLFGGLMYLPAYAASRGRASQDVAQIRILDAKRLTHVTGGGLLQILTSMLPDPPDDTVNGSGSIRGVR
jgi:hypothetical protein